MKIGLLIFGSLDILSGGYLYDRRLVEGLRKAGDTLEIVTLPWRNYLAHLTDNFTFQLPEDLDVLIQDELVHPSLLAANMKQHPYPVISLVHHLRSSEQFPSWQLALYRKVEQKYLRSVDGFIFNSETTKQVVENLIGERKPNVVAHPPTDRFGVGLQKSVVEKRSLKPGPLRVLFLGNVIPRKGLPTLLKAIELTEADVHVDVVGSLDFDPLYARKMKKMVGHLSLSRRVTFHGARQDEGLEQVMRAGHVLTVPSVYEGFGIVYLEAMSMGLPAIGTTAGAAGEIIDDGQTGYLISPGDSEGLARRLDHLAMDRKFLSTMAVAALSRYQEQPSWHETSNSIREFLQDQIETFNPS